MSVRSVSNEPVFFVMMATQTILAMTIMSIVRHRNKRIFILFVITLYFLGLSRSGVVSEMWCYIIRLQSKKFQSALQGLQQAFLECS